MEFDPADYVPEGEISPSIGVNEKSDVSSGERDISLGDENDQEKSFCGTGVIVSGDDDMKMDMIESYGCELVDPYVGMEFDTDEAARDHYNAYARRMGFSVRIGSLSRSRSNREIINGRYFHCAKEGYRHRRKDSDRTQLQRIRTVTRLGCLAKMAIRKRSTGKWVVTIFVQDHNHVLESPSRVQFLRSHRKSSNPVPGAIASCIGTRPSTNLTMSFYREDGGGGDIGLIEQACGNYIGPVQQGKLSRGEAGAIFDYFTRMQAENPAFFHAVHVDDNEHITGFFWVDSKSRMAYEYFGDVVTFDATYRVNRYNAPLAPFSGVNHHNQTVFFGCAVLLDDSELTYIWLFTTWLEAMPGKPPMSIITNQDQAIDAAVARVLPNTCHRYCLQQIQRQVPRKLKGVIQSNRSFSNEFTRCIYETESTNDFEELWGIMCRKYSLIEEEERCLQSLFEIRHRWVPIFLRNSFFAGLSTTQRSETIDAFFSGFVHAQTTICEFVLSNAKALDIWYERETQADLETNYTQPILKTKWPLEKEAAAVYTREMLERFQDELDPCFGYKADASEDDGTTVTYIVKSYEPNSREYMVRLNTFNMIANCSCKWFESTGIICRHILIVFMNRGIGTLPRYYILKRFTRNAKVRDANDEKDYEVQGDCKKSHTWRFNDLCQRAVKYAEDGATSIKSYHAAVRALQKAFEEVNLSKTKSSM